MPNESTLMARLGERMLSFLPGVMSAALFILVVLSNPTLIGRAGRGISPSIVAVFVGLLGAVLQAVLRAHQRRIEQLERLIGQFRESTSK